MKHAYLIIAHNEFEILRRLVEALDDPLNDIYVHIDRKVGELPQLRTRYSHLFLLSRRVDVRWGNVSQIKCELRLMEEAVKNGPYSFYHLISGTHLPLVTQDEFRSWLSRYEGMSVFSRLIQSDGGYQETLKLHRINLFTRWFHSESRILCRLSQFFWKSAIALQRIAGIRINTSGQYYWANNWASFSEEAVGFLLSSRKRILRKYRFSFCGDEFFAPSELMASPLAGRSVRDDRLLYVNIGRSTAETLTEDDYAALSASGCMFARKFSASCMGLPDRIIAEIDERKN